MALRVLFYATASGNRPVLTYIREQEEDAHAALWAAIDALREQHPAAKTVSVKPLRGEVWELRVQDKRGLAHRILYAVVEGRLLLLLHAFTKKTQKTPPAAIRLAEQRLNEMTEAKP
jgi:phage-related protein